MNKKKRTILILLTIAISIIVICSLSVTIYLSTGYKASINPEMLESDDEIKVENDDDYIAFIPKKYDKGLIFYQGAKVDEASYAPLIRKIANEGILCIIAKMPFNFAIFDVDAAEDIIDEFDDIPIKWYISGHSLGGSMASMYAAKNKDEIEGVILLASYSTEDISDLNVLSIYGTNDKILNLEKYEETKVNYPKDLIEIIIEGGNHAYFGSYGEQKNDGIATVSHNEQINITVEAVLNFLE